MLIQVISSSQMQMCMATSVPRLGYLSDESEILQHLKKMR